MTTQRYQFQNDGGDHGESDDLDDLKAPADLVARAGMWQEITDQTTGKRVVRTGHGEWTPTN